VAVVAKADRVRVVDVIDLLCDTPVAGPALEGEFEAMAVQRTGEPGGAHWSSPRGYHWPFTTPPLAAPETPGCSDRQPCLIVGGGRDEPRQP
jgi:hypothetical protein